MFKKVLGIKRLERNYKIIGDSLNRSWRWIDYFHKTNSGYGERITRLEKSNAQLIEVTRELIEQLQRLDSPAAEEIEEEVEEIVREPRVVSVPSSSHQINLPDRDLFLIKLIHQYAAFDKDNSIDTNVIFDNLTYKITRRGLRKKLTSLVDQGLLKTFKKGNARYWYFNEGALGKVKKALRSD